MRKRPTDLSKGHLSWRKQKPKRNTSWQQEAQGAETHPVKFLGACTQRQTPIEHESPERASIKAQSQPHTKRRNPNKRAELHTQSDRGN
jgi:hypothetical protein